MTVSDRFRQSERQLYNAVSGNLLQKFYENALT